MTWIPNRWYVAAWDSEVDRTPIARTICGEPVMLYRKLVDQHVRTEHSV